MSKKEMRGNDALFLRAKREPLLRARGVVRLVDLFSGCGGLTLGVEEAARAHKLALDIRLAAELDDRIRATYAANFVVAPDRLHADVQSCFDGRFGRPLTEREQKTAALVRRGVDILVGGPPCQGHSTLNNRTRGDDPKNRLYLTMVRAAEVLNPRVVIIENVPPVERDKGRVVEQAKRMLTTLGYGVDAAVISMVDIGVPQLRRRHVMVAVRGSTPSMSNAVAARRVTQPRDLEWAIGDLRGAQRSPLDAASIMSPENLRRARHLLRTGQYDLPNRLRPPCQRGEHKYKSMYGRLRWDAPAQTITTGFGSPGQGRYLHPDEPRTLTPHEAARLQFFPDWFRFENLYRGELARAIGNAVPPKLSFVLASEFLRLERVARDLRTTEARSQVALFG